MHNKRNKYRLVVITVTYKPDLTELKAFIDSFYKYNDLGDEAKLIIVDNSPSDYHHVKSLASQYDLSYKSCPNNPGFGTANNIGFELFDSEYALFVNNDTEFIEPLFNRIIKIHESNKNIGCIGIHQIGGSPSFFPKMTAPPNIQNKIFQDEYHFISGAFMFLKSSVFKKSGKFDSNLFMYFEEFDLSSRLIQNGFHTIYIPNLSIWHKVKNRRVINEETWKRAIPSFCYICRKYKLNPQKYSKPIMKRLRLLFIYQCFLLNFKEAAKIWRVYRYRQHIIYKEFKLKI